MSSAIDIDELVASLAGNHIGQHNIDLAKVRDQLAQMLFLQANLPQPQQQQQQPQPATHNTPTTRTAMPSNWLPEPRKRSASLALPAAYDICEEDEHDVEMMLDGAIPPSAYYFNPPNSPQQRNVGPVGAAPSPPPQSPTAAYALADPFFAQVLSHERSQQPAYFAQGNPTAPFFMQTAERPPLSIDTRYCVPSDGRRDAF